MTVAVPDNKKAGFAYKNEQPPHVNNGFVADAPGQGLHRKLKNRHIQMISIGGVIGTGLFLGSANALRHGGPLGLLLGYSIMGSIVFCVMIALGEMVGQLPIQGGHITLSARFVDKAMAFAMGWNYWYNWTIVLPAELSAAAVLIGYWAPNTNAAAWIAICLIVAVAINFGGTRVYGEAEYWFAMIKVLTIIGLIILGLVLDAGGGPDHRAIGSKYWRDPGPFVQYLDIPGPLGRFAGFWAVLIQASFSYIGTEIVAIAAGEAQNPRRNLPKAIKRVYIRICLFYIFGVFIIGLLVPSNDPRLNLGSGTAASSPFVIAMSNASIKGLPGLVNACILTSAWSAASSDLYTSSRALYGLALSGNAPKILTRTNRWGLPYLCVCVGVLFSLLAFMAAGKGEAGKIFGYFANMTSVSGLLTWFGILITYIRWHRGIMLQKIDRSDFPYVAPLQPYASIYALVMIILVLFFNGFGVFVHGNWNLATFLTSYIPIWLFPVLYFGALVTMKCRPTPLRELDYFVGSRDAPEEDDPPPKNTMERFWRWIM